jgi:hypothetical protein
LLPEASRGSLIAFPAIGVGLEINKWAFVMLKKAEATTAMRPTEGMVLKLSMFAECVVGSKDCLRVVEFVVLLES